MYAILLTFVEYHVINKKNHLLTSKIESFIIQNI